MGCGLSTENLNPLLPPSANLFVAPGQQVHQDTSIEITSHLLGHDAGVGRFSVQSHGHEIMKISPKNATVPLPWGYRARSIQAKDPKGKWKDICESSKAFTLGDVFKCRLPNPSLVKPGAEIFTLRATGGHLVTEIPGVGQLTLDLNRAKTKQGAALLMGGYQCAFIRKSGRRTFSVSVQPNMDIVIVLTNVIAMYDIGNISALMKAGKHAVPGLGGKTGQVAQFAVNQSGLGKGGDAGYSQVSAQEMVMEKAKGYVVPAAHGFVGEQVMKRMPSGYADSGYVSGPPSRAREMAIGMGKAYVVPAAQAYVEERVMKRLPSGYADSGYVSEASSRAQSQERFAHAERPVSRKRQ